MYYLQCFDHVYLTGDFEMVSFFFLNLNFSSKMFHSLRSVFPFTFLHLINNEALYLKERFYNFKKYTSGSVYSAELIVFISSNNLKLCCSFTASVMNSFWKA